MGSEIWVAEVSDLAYPRVLNKDTPRLLLGRIVSEHKDKTPSQYVDLINNGLNTNSEVTNHASIFAKKHPLKVRIDLLDDLSRRVITKHDDLIREAKEFFEKKGYVVDTFGASRTYTIYVIDLHSSTRIDSAPWVYVGQTTLTPEERFKKHLAEGPTASSEVTKYGLRLNFDLYKNVPQTNFYKDALALKCATAIDLETKGYTVAGGH